MPLYIAYRNESDTTRAVIEFLHDFNKRTGRTIEEIDPDSPHGSSFVELYDIVEYPSIVASKEDGEIRYLWRGVPLPTIDEVSYYAD